MCQLIQQTIFIVLPLCNIPAGTFLFRKVPLFIILILYPQRLLPFCNPNQMYWPQETVPFPADSCSIWINHPLPLSHTAPLITYCSPFVVSDAERITLAVTFNPYLSQPVFYHCKLPQWSIFQLRPPSIVIQNTLDLSVLRISIFRYQPLPVCFLCYPAQRIIEILLI